MDENVLTPDRSEQSSEEQMESYFDLVKRAFAQISCVRFVLDIFRLIFHIKYKFWSFESLYLWKLYMP